MKKDFDLDLTPYDDLFSTQEIRDDAKLEKVREIPLTELHPFKNHPFTVKDDDAMQEMADSIKNYGVLNPAIARPDPDGGYELIAGHRRKRACEIAEKETMPVLIREMDDDTATILMVDSNIQREDILPSERAFSFKMKLEALKHQGKRPSADEDHDSGEKPLWSADQIAEDSGVSKTQVMRYVHLTELIKPLLDKLDDGKIAFNTAYELSFLMSDEQYMLLDYMDSNGMVPSLSQAGELKGLSLKGELSSAVMALTLAENRKPKEKSVTFKEDALRWYFPTGTTAQQMKDKILELLEAWRSGQDDDEIEDAE